MPHVACCAFVSRAEWPVRRPGLDTMPPPALCRRLCRGCMKSVECFEMLLPYGALVRALAVPCCAARRRRRYALLAWVRCAFHRWCSRPLPTVTNRHWTRSGYFLRQSRARRCPHLHRDSARRAHICTGTGLAAATSAPGLGSPRPHLHRDSARRCHICARTGFALPTSAPALGSPRPHLHRDWARRCHICTGTRL
jgi:hypothetical protein